MDKKIIAVASRSEIWNIISVISLLAINYSTCPSTVNISREMIHCNNHVRAVLFVDPA